MQIVSVQGEALRLAFAIRREVFIHEQGVPESEEFDAHEATAEHLLVLDAAGEPIATARWRRLPDGAKFERIAVRARWRGQGIGRALVEELLLRARQAGCRRFSLSAQLQALDFYRRAAFVPEGEIFTDGGIPHRRMVRYDDSAASSSACRAWEKSE